MSKGKVLGKSVQTINLKSWKDLDKIVWCNSVHGEYICHLSTATDRALLITSLVPWNSAFDGCEAGQQSNSWGCSWHRGLPSTAPFFSKNKVQKQRERKYKKPNQPGKNIVATRWQNPLEVAAVAVAQALCVPSYSRFRHSCFRPKLIFDKSNL